jgi:hypothetical protein
MGRERRGDQRLFMGRHAVGQVAETGAGFAPSMSRPRPKRSAALRNSRTCPGQSLAAIAASVSGGTSGIGAARLLRKLGQQLQEQ